MAKKMQFVLVAFIVLTLLLTACGGQATPVTEEPAAPEEAPAQEEPAAAAEEPTAAEEEAPAEEAAPVEEEAPTEEAMPVQSDVVVSVTPASQSVTTFTRNFNPFTATPLFPTVYGIYEPLMINNKITGELTPWLATGYSWSEDLLTLTFTLQEGIMWSDGEPFTASDVAYTFNLLKENSSLIADALSAVTEGGYVDTITAVDDTTVEFAFNRAYTPGLYDIIQQIIVPEHVWSEVEDPVTFTNDNPVATGPFTEVVNFQEQVYEVDRNPNYWQEGKPYIKGVQGLGFSGNDTAATMFVNGDVEWTGQFYPNVQEAVLSKNPEDLHCWWPAVTSDQLFMVNTTKAPFDDAVVRKAISMSFDREKLIEIAIQGSSTAADVTGLSSGYAAWKVEDPSALGNWTDYDPEAANAMLDEAGYALNDDGVRTNLDGTPIDVELLMVNGFSDWLAVAPLLKQELEAIGFSVTINSYDVPIAFDKWMKGEFDVSLFFGMTADLPYNYYRDIMSTSTVMPVGETSPLGVNNWRYGNEEADVALEAFSTTADLDVQKEAAIKLQEIFAENAPVLPMWHAPTFYCYNDSQVTNWPSADNPYAYPMPIGGNAVDPAQLIVLTSLQGR